MIIQHTFILVQTYFDHGNLCDCSKGKTFVEVKRNISCFLFYHFDVISDPDDFIVDEDGEPISKTKKKRHIIHDDKYATFSKMSTCTINLASGVIINFFFSNNEWWYKI